VNQTHTVHPVYSDSSMNYSYESVLLSESKPCSAISSLNNELMTRMSQFFLLSQKHKVGF